MSPQPPEGYQHQPQKKQSWFQKLAQLYQDDVARRESRAADKDKMIKIRASESPEGQQARNEAYPWLAKRADNAKTATNPKQAAKKDAVPGWVQRKVDRRIARARAIYGDAVTDKEGKLTSKALLKKDQLEEMDDLLAFISKSPVPAFVYPDYTPEERAMVTDKNEANQTEYLKALKRYNELADLNNEPRFGDKEVKTGDKEVKKKGNGKKEDKPDFTNPNLKITPELIVETYENGDSADIAALDSSLNAQLPPIEEEGEGKNLLGDAVGKLAEQVVEKHKEQASTKQKTAERNAIIAKARKAGHIWTQKELYQYNETGVLPEAVEKLLNQSK